MARTPARALAAAALTLALAALTGCGIEDAARDAAEDAASDAATDVACQVATDAADQATATATAAADTINVDPQQAKDDLQTVSDALAIAQVATQGDLNTDLVTAKTAIDLLLDEATAAVAGDIVDTNVVNAAQDQLTGAVADIKATC